jgi:hypothetical protein
MKYSPSEKEFSRKNLKGWTNEKIIPNSKLHDLTPAYTAIDESL